MLLSFLMPVVLVCSWISKPPVAEFHYTVQVAVSSCLNHWTTREAPLTHFLESTTK